MKRLALVLLGAALATGLAASPASAQEQTFKSISSGPAPAPWPTPTSWPADWYGSLYYPAYWPVCTTPATYHCRPHNGHVWPPKGNPPPHAAPHAASGKPPI